MVKVGEFVKVALDIRANVLRGVLAGYRTHSSRERKSRAQATHDSLFQLAAHCQAAAS
jgi:hypothetical protein